MILATFETLSLIDFLPYSPELATPISDTSVKVSNNHSARIMGPNQHQINNEKKVRLDFLFFPFLPLLSSPIRRSICQCLGFPWPK